MYRLLEYDPSRRLPPACSLYEKAVTLSGLSKSFALPGLRLGWLATREASILEGCQAFKDYTTICASAPSEILGIVALRAKETLLGRNLAIILSNLQAANDFLTASRIILPGLNRARARWPFLDGPAGPRSRPSARQCSTNRA